MSKALCWLVVFYGVALPLRAAPLNALDNETPIHAPVSPQAVKQIPPGFRFIEPGYLTDDASATLYLLSGRADALFGPHSVAAWKVASRGQTKIVGNGPVRAWVAVTTKKGNGLAPALQAALNSVIAGGQYQQVLARWGEQDEGIAQSQVNPPGVVY